MSERRVAQVVSQAGCGHNLLSRLQGSQRGGIAGIFRSQQKSHFRGQRTSHGSHLKRMGEAVVHKHAARERKDLGLVLQAPER